MSNSVAIAQPRAASIFGG